MTVIKICGLTNVEDALVAATAGAALLGFILYPKSPRYVAPALVREVIAQVRATIQPAPTCVGVFVNTPAEEVARMLDETSLDLAQLHGDETPSAVAALQGRAYKALRPRKIEEAVTSAERFLPVTIGAGPHLLVDAWDPHAYGGTGQTGDWQIAAAIAGRVPRLLLAGGLTATNVALAIEQVKPWGVDVASGVEASPGKKDHAAVRDFCLAAGKGTAQR